MNFDIISHVTGCSSVYETDDDKYNMCVVLYNDGNECPLRQQSIKSLNIINDFHNPFYSGVLDILNENDILESSNEPSLKLLAPGFKLINNGRDFVFIYISSYTENILENLDNPSNIVMMFVINGSEDLFIDGKKIKRLFLKDYTEQVLSEYMNGFSTGFYAYKLSQFNKNISNKTTTFDINSNLITIEESDKLIISQLTNKERSLTTGRCISFLLKKAFPDSYINNKLWDFGGPEIFYSETNNQSYLDVLNELLVLHNASSTDKDKCYLNYSINTETNEYEWTFISISKMFKFSDNQFLLEAFELTTNNMDLSETSSNSVDQYSPKIPGFAGNTGNISQFFFSDFSSEINLQNIKSSFIYNYDYINKEFFIDAETSNFKQILNSFNNNYIKELFPNTPYNSLQINNKNMNHIINLYPTDTNISVGRNNALNKLIALNNAIQFSVIGNLNRKSGYFIVINKQSASSDNQFFNKILGKYFILNIHHIFNDKRYTNNIIACKPFYNTEPIAPLNYILENE